MSEAVLEKVEVGLLSDEELVGMFEEGTRQAALFSRSGKESWEREKGCKIGDLKEEVLRRVSAKVELVA